MLLRLLAQEILMEKENIKILNIGKIKKRKTGMIKVLCKICNTQVNSVVYTKHLERCSSI
ncbi:hypothetical protein NEOKW01_0007 [Nematocida sp. AWRm80]|nr:hypothetical protein NEOKW01_0007 [Nematocida sp. AWRm80]